MNKSCVNCTTFRLETREIMCYITITKGKAEEKRQILLKSSTQDAKAGVKGDKTTAFKNEEIPIRSLQVKW